MDKFLKFNAIPIKFLVAYFCRNGKKSLKIHVESQILNSQNNVEEKKKTKQSWKLHVLNLKTYCESNHYNIVKKKNLKKKYDTGIREAYRPMGQNKEPKITPHLNSKMGSLIMVPRAFNGEKIIFSINGIRETRYTHTRE